jgi:DNA-directed RNA polymerase subunit RPC12/RpoP
MATCDVCGNEYDNAMTVEVPGRGSGTFDSFECAIHALAPVCEHCGIRIIGHGVQAGAAVYCCAHCAQQEGHPELRDRAG